MTYQHQDKSDNAEVKRYDALAAAEHIPEMVQRIVSEFDPQKIILFGSHARGDANRWSDIDLLVVFPELQNKRDMAVAIRRVLRDVPFPKDVVVTDYAEISCRGDLIGSVLRPALREGTTMYERPKSTA